MPAGCQLFASHLADALFYPPDDAAKNWTASGARRNAASMITLTYPSPNPVHRRADLAVHAFGLALILIAGTALLWRAAGLLDAALLAALTIYVLAALASNLASWTYHFAPWHARRVFLRRIDHAAIYPSITGTFTPFFVLADTPWTLFLLIFSWGLTVLAIWMKLTRSEVKSKWSTASYLGLGAVGLAALPDLTGTPVETLWCVLAGAAAYVIGTAFYAQRGLPFRYAIWHIWVNLGAIGMLAGLWWAVFQ